MFDNYAREYQEMCGAGRAGGDRDLKTAEARLTWLVYIIGSAVGGRVSFNSNEDHDAMDGELVCRVLQLMQVGRKLKKMILIINFFPISS